MRQLKIGNKIITDDDCFIIAEIGSNHMGSFDECVRLIREAALCGADAAKLQVRDNAAMFTKTLLQSPYNNELSYGVTYGEHRQHLDWFGEKELLDLKATADNFGILLFATPFEEKSADLLNRIDFPVFKIASCDATNLPFVKYVAGLGKPLILSTGGANIYEIGELVAAVEKKSCNFALLHCVSTYPNTDETVSLNFIKHLRERFRDVLIGFSSHHPGLLPLYVARTLGAGVFEVHFTMNRGNRGTDHGFSMEPQGLKRLCEDLPRIRTIMGSYEKNIPAGEKNGFVKKFGKSVYLKRPLPAGRVVTAEDLCVKSPAGGIRPHEAFRIVGKSLISELSTGISLKEEYFK